MNLAEMRRRRDELVARAKALVDAASGRDLEGADAEQFAECTSGVKALDKQIATLERAISDPTSTEPGSVGDPKPRSNSERDKALRVLESRTKDGSLTPSSAERVETLLGQGTSQSRSWTARWAAAAGSDDYERAFAKLVADSERGHLLWTPDEAAAYRTVAELAAESRAMGIASGSIGGHMVPLTLDPAVLLSSGGSSNPLRTIARTVTITTDSWHGISSEGVEANWYSEAAEVSDDSPTIAKPDIPVHRASAFVPFSFEIEGDAVNLLGELRTLLLDAADQLTAQAFVVGSGNGEPTGFVTALAAQAGSIVTGDGSEALVSGDAYKLQGALPPRFQGSARWVANLGILNQMRQFETQNGSLKFLGLQTDPPVLLGRPIHEVSHMTGVIDPNVTSANYLLAYGDWSQYVIVDRVGSRIELIPNLFGANRRPTGQRGAFLWFRVGADVVVPNAFRMLNVPTTA